MILALEPVRLCRSHTCRVCRQGQLALVGRSGSRVCECARATLLILALLGTGLPTLALRCAIAWRRLLCLLGWLPAPCASRSRRCCLHLTPPVNRSVPILLPTRLGPLLPEWGSSRGCLWRVGQPLLWTAARLIPGWCLDPAASTNSRLDVVQLLKFASISTPARLSEARLMRPRSTSLPACLHEGGPLDPSNSAPASWCEARLLWLALRPPACLAEAGLPRDPINSTPACLCRSRLLLWTILVPPGALDVPPGTRQPRHWRSSRQRALQGGRSWPWCSCMGPARLVKARPAGLSFCRGRCPLAVLPLPLTSVKRGTSSRPPSTPTANCHPASFLRWGCLHRVLAKGWLLKAALRRLGQPTMRWQGQPALAWQPLLHKGPGCGAWPPLVPAVSSHHRRLLQRTSERLLVPSWLPLGHARLRHAMLLPGCAIVLCLVQLGTLVLSKGVALLGLKAILVNPSRWLLACCRMSPACTRTKRFTL